MSSNIVTHAAGKSQDPLVQNLIKKEFLNKRHWNPKLQSLIPPNMWYFLPEQEGLGESELNRIHKTWYIDSPTEFVNFDGTTTRYVIVARWWTEIDPRGFKRLFRKKGWHRGNEIRYYDRLTKTWLEGRERSAFVSEQLEPRLQRVLGIKKLSSATMRRYRFNFACQYPDGNLRDRDGHHQQMGNKTAQRINPSLDKSWYLATDDRPWNIISMSPEEHNEEHNRLKDTRFEFYRELDENNESYQWNQHEGWIN